ncbi:MAG: hypothetical protein KBB54_01320 [Candidatus Pacebacteria bacterium]|nr:hypothetical protein [Candidatus Paceibacterota bacterium]MDQ5950011.1 DNA-directed polymerase subunit alpha [Patescibacteria group bacterium]
MPVIKTWCLPKMEEKELHDLHNALVAAVVSIEELGYKSEKDMTLLYPSDLMQYGLGTDIVVEATMFEKPMCTSTVKQKLAKALGTVIQQKIPTAERVGCFVYSFNRPSGFWTSVLSEDGFTQEQEDILNSTKLEDLDISVRAMQCIKSAKITSLRDLVGYRESDLMKFRNFGQRSATELNEALVRIGLQLSPE